MKELETIQSIFEKHTTRYHFYLKDLRTGQEVELGTRKHYPICSCFKLAVLMAYFDSLQSVDELYEEVIIDPKNFSPGGGVINFLDTPVKYTYLQMAQMMMAFSDSTSTDFLIEKVGFLKVKRIFDSSVSQPAENSIQSKVGDFVSRYLSNIKQHTLEDYIQSYQDHFLNTDFTNAKGIADLALSASQFKVSIQNKQADQLQSLYQKCLKTKKLVPLTGAYLTTPFEMINKTGSLGFGTFINDCGVVYKNQNELFQFGYTTEGWKINKNIAEVILGVVGIYMCKYFDSEFTPNHFFRAESYELVK